LGEHKQLETFAMQLVAKAVPSPKIIQQPSEEASKSTFQQGIRIGMGLQERPMLVGEATDKNSWERYWLARGIKAGRTVRRRL
jgi:hypothetical protein